MSIELILTLIAIAATPLTGWLASKLTKSRYDAEIGRLRAEIAKAKADADGKELANARLGNEIIMENIVKPLEGNIKRLNRNVTRLEKAIDKIPACPHSAECPVSRELLVDKTGDDDEPGGDRPDRGAGDFRPRDHN